MSYKMMWAICIEGFNTDIHGTAYCETKEEASFKLRELALDDLEKLKKCELWRDWSATVYEHGMLAKVHSFTGCADDWDQEKGVYYRVIRKRLSV